MSPIDAFVDWAAPLAPGYIRTRGIWREGAPTDRYMAIWASPGGAPSGDAGRVIIRLALVGMRQSPEDVVKVEADVKAMAADAIERYNTECISNVRPMAMPAGPFYTTENRVYYELNFEILMRM